MDSGSVGCSRGILRSDGSARAFRDIDFFRFKGIGSVSDGIGETFRFGVVRDDESEVFRNGKSGEGKGPPVFLIVGVKFPVILHEEIGGREEDEPGHETGGEVSSDEKVSGHRCGSYLRSKRVKNQVIFRIAGHRIAD